MTKTHTDKDGYKILESFRFIDNVVCLRIVSPDGTSIHEIIPEELTSKESINEWFKIYKQELKKMPKKNNTAKPTKKTTKKPVKKVKKPTKTYKGGY